MKTPRLSGLLLSMLVTMTSASVGGVEAAVPATMSYQGLLTGPGGQPVPDGDHAFTFRMFSSETGGTALWQENQSLNTTAGLFNAILGSVSPLNIPFDTQYWLETVVDDSLLAPRVNLASSPYALRAAVADSIAGGGTDSWDTDGTNIYRLTGYVGIGVTDPQCKLFAAVADDARPAIGGLNTADSGVGIAGAGNSQDAYAPPQGCGVAATGTRMGAWGFGRTDSESRAGVVGVIDSGNAQLIADGSGMAGTGEQYGVFGYARTQSAVQRAGGYFSNADGGYAFVAARAINGWAYKIQGTGLVSSVVDTPSNGRVALLAPESPEAWLQDFGTGEMQRGAGIVSLDPTFLECASTSRDEDLRVFIQFTSPPPRSYYIRKSPDHFEVIDASGEQTSATFDYFVVARWKGWETARFEKALEPPMTMEVGAAEGLGKQR